MINWSSNYRRLPAIPPQVWEGNHGAQHLPEESENMVTLLDILMLLCMLRWSIHVYCIWIQLPFVLATIPGAHWSLYYKLPVQDTIWIRFKSWSVSNHLEDNYTIQDDVKSVREGPIAFRGLALFVICSTKCTRIFVNRQKRNLNCTSSSMLSTSRGPGKSSNWSNSPRSKSNIPFFLGQELPQHISVSYNWRCFHGEHSHCILTTGAISQIHKICPRGGRLCPIFRFKKTTVINSITIILVISINQNHFTSSIKTLLEGGVLCHR